MCLNETYIRVRVDKHLSNTFPIRTNLRQGDALSPFLFHSAVEYVVRKVQVHQDGLKLNGTHQLLFYADDDNMFGGSVQSIKNTEVLVVASKETGLDVNSDKTKYMVMFQDQNAVRIHNIKTDSSFERVGGFKYLGKPSESKLYSGRN